MLTDWQFRALVFLVVTAQGDAIAEELGGHKEWECVAIEGGLMDRQRAEWLRVEKLRLRIAELVPGRDLIEVLDELNDAVRAAHAHACGLPPGERR